ncbi:bactofilin [Cohnella faecalis]|uniref:Bactofilin n=1 Tax=Cohnella faecalis TaxID=2315694 RepID=A0A398CK62_9BACL|nr:bactofilin [Cohnella faecalis]RIE02690.1 bactofilin [Cohnella faecalis]
MADETRQDLKMVGTTSSGGGRFRSVKITGESVLNGAVDCDKLACTGELVVKGELRSDEVKVMGECRIEGPLNAGSVRGQGEIEVKASARVETMKMTGNVDVGGHFESGDLRLFGGFRVEGLLSAERLELRMYGPCRAKEIGGGTLIVKRSRAAALAKWIKPHSQAMLNVDIVEGDSVELEHTTAGIVRGNRVVIGPGCEIGRLEYRDSLVLHKNAIVKDQVKL